MNNAPESPQASDYASNHPGYRTLEVAEHPDPAMNIRLIEPDLRYAKESLQWLSDAEVGQYMGADFSELSLEGEQKRLQEILDNNDQYNWLIESDSKVIGNVNINSIAEKSGQEQCRAGSLAILIGDKESWGKKIGRSVNKAVLDWAFTDGKFDLIHARIRQENIGSIKSFTALGFEETGTESEEIGGQPVLWRHYKMTKEQWLQKKL